jgi:ABC-type multidrug transport system fused ATPase/permease subunit
VISPRDIRPFAGGKTLAYLVLSVVAGLLLFAVEVGFAYALQSFLLLLGIAAPGTLHVPPWFPRQHASAVIVSVFVLSVLRGSLIWTQSYTRDAAGEGFSCLQRARILQWAFFSRGASSSHVTTMFGERVTQAGIWVRQILTALNIGTLCVLLLAALAYLQPYVTLAAVAILLALMAPVRWMNRRLRRAGQGVVAEWNDTYRRLVRSVRNLLLLRIYGLEQAEQGRASASLQSYLRHYSTYQTTAGLFLVIPQTLGVTLICVLLLVARAHIQLSAGLLLLYFYLLVRLLQNSAPAGQAIANALFQWPQVAAVYDWWRTEYLPSGVSGRQPHAESVPGTLPSGAVGWSGQQVSFSYPGAARPVLRGLSFEIAPGSAVVITGPSGAGKSTLLNLLLGELTPLEGRIDVVADGRRTPLADCRARLMPGVGYVGEDSFIIDGTIRENLAYGVHTAASDAELARALERAECGFINDLPNGLDHRLTDQGAGLSSGQKQRLSLARALLRRPGVLVLDEATANLDSATEDKLVDTLTQLKGGMTIVAVTHRQALLRLADQVLMLDA